MTDFTDEQLKNFRVDMRAVEQAGHNFIKNQEQIQKAENDQKDYIDHEVEILIAHFFTEEEREMYKAIGQDPYDISTRTVDCPMSPARALFDRSDALTISSLIKAVYCVSRTVGQDLMAERAGVHVYELFPERNAQKYWKNIGNISQLASDLIVEERTRQLISMTDVMNFIDGVEARVQIIQRKAGTLQVVLLEGETESRELKLWALSTLEIIEKFKGEMLAIQHDAGEKW